DVLRASSPAGLGGARREAEGALRMPVLITGASSGIGAGLATSFAADGLMVLTATGYFYTSLRLAGRWIETVYLVMI
ncbi:hypothetical protein, partial [Klebsiella pneumoniae]|uniref:hypothetical protein n=1 Tax=Klebsiella pneumoniae TaxID=573 RepID=UPI003F7F9437